MSVTFVANFGTRLVTDFTEKTLVGLSPTHFYAYKEGNNFWLDFTGDFQGSVESIDGGTLSSISAYYRDTSGEDLGYATISGIDTAVDAAVVFDHAALGEWDLLWTEVFAGDDTLTGSDGDDHLKAYAGNDTLAGNSGNDSIEGGDGDDTLNGGLGRDTLIGGLGNDQYHVDRTLDVVTETENSGTDTVVAGISFTLGLHIENLTLTGSGPYFGTGNDLNNVLTGNAGANKLTGGKGDDTYHVGAGDTTIEQFDGGLDTVFAAANWTLSEDTEYLVLTDTAVSGTGNGLSNKVTGNTTNNSLSGMAGNDTMDGGDGLDTLDGGAGNDSLIGGSNKDEIKGQEGFDTLSGGTGEDTLVGWTGNDSLRGGDQSDALYGEEGPGETLPETEALVPATHDAVVNLDENVFSLFGEASADPLELGSILLGEEAKLDIQSAIYIGASKASSVFSSIDFGGSGYFKLGQGILMTSGSGDPALTNSSPGYTQANKQLGDETLDKIASEAFSGSGTTQDASVLELTFTTSEAGGKISLDLMFGSDEYPEYSDSSFVDIAAVEIDGKNYALFNDDPSQPLSVIRKNLGVGNFYDNRKGVLDIEYDGMSAPLRVVGDLDPAKTEHTIRIAIADTGDQALDSGMFLSNLKWRDATFESGIGVVTGYDDKLFGENGTDSLFGGIGNDLLNGGAGADTLNGGPDDDTYIVDHTGDVVVEADSEGTDTVKSSADTYTLAEHMEMLTLTGGKAINGTGNALDNYILGNQANNSITAGDGNDTVDGGRGNDVLDGGNGIDTVSFASATKAVTVNLKKTLAQDTRGGNTDTLSNFENATGGTGNDALYGNTEANVLDGGAGYDTLRGGAGNDTYIVDDAKDFPSEQKIMGTDKVMSTVDWWLKPNLENLELIGSKNVDGTGNGVGNVILGNVGANVLAGLQGADSLAGGQGSDVIIGGAGMDTLTGDDGETDERDYFVFDQTPNAANLDAITDFNISDDVIVFKAVEDGLFWEVVPTDDPDYDPYGPVESDAALIAPVARKGETDWTFDSTKLGVLSDTKFIVGTAALDSDDRIIFNDTTGALYYDADGSGFGTAVQVATLTIVGLGEVDQMTAANFAFYRPEA